MYSDDLRKKVLKYFHEGHTYRNTCEVFHISPATLCDWLKREKAGDLKPKCHGTKPKIDREKLKECVDANPDMYQDELAKLFGCSQSTISYNLKKLGYVFKKKNAAMSNRTLSR